MAARFYTGKGDDGTTGLLGAQRVLKCDEQIEALGCLDEANAALGFARSLTAHPENADRILRIQKELYLILAELAAAPENAERFHSIEEVNVIWLAEQTDQLSTQVEMPREFIIPGASPSAAAFSMARTAVRRAVRLHQKQPLKYAAVILAYLNRLSSLCFAFEVFETLKDTGTTIKFAKG
jgi:cob(I)alamin adenosyltransferase